MENNKTKIALVTGGATGIGRATSVALAKQGVTVIVADINEAESMHTIELVSKEGGKAEFMHLDVGHKDQIFATIEAIVKKHGTLDYAVNNAGIGGPPARIPDIQTEDWDHMININLSSVMYCMQAELKIMVEKGSGSIVNIASLAGLNGFPTAAPYCVAKHGVIGLTKTGAAEYGSQNIRVNCVCPGFIQTPIVAGVPKEILDYSTNIRVPMKRIGQPNEVGQTIAWLLSDEASYVNGHSMIIDGGMMTG